MTKMDMTNLEKTNVQIPYYQLLWGADNKALPKVFYARYANRTFSKDVVVVSGTISVSYSRLYAMISPLFRFMGSLVPYPAKNIPVTVKFHSEEHSTKVSFKRAFSYTPEKAVCFNSKLFPVKDNIVVEFMKFNVGWRARFILDGNRIRMIHAGYVFKLFNFLIPLPLSLLIGHAYAEEEAISDNEFKMLLTIKHPLLGELFEYHGQFKMVEPLC